MVTEAPAPRKETDDLGTLLNSLLAWARNHDDSFTFVGPAAASAGAVVALEVQVHDVNNILEPFTLAGQVTVDRTGGSGGTPLMIAADGRSDATALLIPVYDGVGAVDVSIVGTGTIILGLTDSGSTGLDVADTHTVTWS